MRRVLERGGAAVSRLSEVEVASALMRRVRLGSLPAEEYARAAQALRADLADLEVVELETRVMTFATTLLERHPLRAGDAIQLASCLILRDSLPEQVGFLAYDRRLNEAAAREGLQPATAD